MTISVTESKLFEYVRAFLLEVIGDPATPVIRSQGNRVAPPKAPLWLVMTGRSRVALSTTTEDWDQQPGPDPTALTHTHKVRANIQLDVYGETSADVASTVSALFRTPYAADFFAAKSAAVAPLYATDGQQMPLISGEEQYISRWTMELALQANLDVSTNQDFLDSVQVEPVNVDVAYPPGA